MVKQHRLHSYLAGTQAVPPTTMQDASGHLIQNPSYDDYEQQDSALASWLLASVSPSVLPELVGFDTSSQIWHQLCQLYSNKSVLKLFLPIKRKVI